MQKTPSFAAKEAYQFMLEHSVQVDGIWLSSKLALMTWVNKSEAVALMRELSNCGLFNKKFDSTDSSAGDINPEKVPSPQEE